MLGVLPAESRIAVVRQTQSALSALEAFVAGAKLDRQAVATAVVLLELEMRRLARMNGAIAPAAERKRLWDEIDLIAREL